MEPNADEATEPDQRVLEACPACEKLMDVSQIFPFTEIACPSCGESMRARKRFNNFTILSLLGEGGMGSVFKAMDGTLDRYVALKILKKEISANAEEQAKLEEEAQMTATINHPHVVKVFDFGQDHGQFYLAMELVEKGSLDQLMTVQRRVAEIQMLEVAIQIARGLEAALDAGLIHRDIKPGNILFADPHTAKLVDFGLAIVMDEGAQSKGEIWGTPYYIAPEKLDNQPEDFRSDIYSLGGTIFHALAGRPPYEAETASMVALKQLKSQPVSLQAFAPDVSSETAYVINRMMAKAPEDRYQSYEELIGHLTYAREKLLERIRKPHQPKERVVLETAETRKWSAFLSLGILLGILAIGVAVFLNRETLFPKQVNATVQVISEADAQTRLQAGVTMIGEGDFEGAKAEFTGLANEKGVQQPQKNWALFNAAVAALLTGDQEAALANLEAVTNAGLYSSAPDDQRLANFFVETSRVVQKGKPIPASIRNLYTGRNEAFALLIFGVWDWEAKGSFQDAAGLFKAFLASQSKDPLVLGYRPLVEKYLADWKLLEPIESALAAPVTPANVPAIRAQIAALRGNLQTGSRISEQLDALEKKLAQPPK
ncbi:MAG: serine/threonine-protein kinase [Terrimicrobiaceae bacterium]